MSTADSKATYLAGVRVLEFADELGEYTGKVLAGLGADVVKVEPPQGESTRRIGPFLDDQPGAERSLHFWHYNHGKRGITLDLDDRSDLDALRDLAREADVIIDTRPKGWMEQRGLGYEDLRLINPGLLYVRITPFGDDGPWADHRASDLIHLALGGVMMNCGYDPDPRGFYETPPIAPAMWHSYQIAGEVTVISLIAALIYRRSTGVGQKLSTSVHEAVSKNTETDLPDWVFLKQVHRRVTCRHSMVSSSVPALAITKDGRYLMPYRTYLKGKVTASDDAWDRTVSVLDQFGMADGIRGGKYDDSDYRATEEATDRLADLTNRMISTTLFDAEVWRAGQEAGLPWAPIRKPEENIHDSHWRQRGTFAQVEHPELNRSFTYVGARWVCDQAPWRVGKRAPLLGEHTGEVIQEWARDNRARAAGEPTISPIVEGMVSTPEGKPFALSGVRVIDLSWMLASAGAGRFLASMGAEVIKVEHETRWDGMRFGLGVYPPGGREERDAAQSAIPTPQTRNPNHGGSFMEINAGKLGISLNLKSDEGKKILEDLIRGADMIVEGYSPGTLERMGFGYARLREINPAIIYVQQSGFGQRGTYGRARAFGPTAQAFSGISEMSGLPSPYPPAGIGYSYLDWFGAYNMATAMLAALHRRDQTGEGCHIDASQGEIGIYLTGTAVLDSSANKRPWARYGNRSPYVDAAPHGAFRVAGEDRWIAIAVFSDQDWDTLVSVLNNPEWARDERFATLSSRITHQDDLEALLSAETSVWDGFELQERLQAAGVVAGVCQTAQDRYERDPQLAFDNWLVELPQSDIGTWPVKDHPVRLSETPGYVGGRFGRSGPSYGEDTDDVLGRLLGIDDEQLDAYRRAGVV